MDLSRVEHDDVALAGEVGARGAAQPMPAGGDDAERELGMKMRAEPVRGAVGPHQIDAPIGHRYPRYVRCNHEPLTLQPHNCLDIAALTAYYNVTS